MQIYGPVHVHGAEAVHAPHAAARTAPAGVTEGVVIPRDEVAISDSAGFVDQVHTLPDIRADRVNDIRAALAQGTYDIDGRLDAAVERLLDELA